MISTSLRSLNFPRIGWLPIPRGNEHQFTNFYSLLIICNWTGQLLLTLSSPCIADLCRQEYRCSARAQEKLRTPFMAIRIIDLETTGCAKYSCESQSQKCAHFVASFCHPGSGMSGVVDAFEFISKRCASTCRCRKTRGPCPRPADDRDDPLGGTNSPNPVQA